MDTQDMISSDFSCKISELEKSGKLVAIKSLRSFASAYFSDISVVLIKLPTPVSVGYSYLLITAVKYI
jgi:hypothetical protein